MYLSCVATFRFNVLIFFFNLKTDLSTNIKFSGNINKSQQKTTYTNQTVKTNGEPKAFALSGGGGYGVASDNFSFLDQDHQSLSAKGNGGMRQQHHYADIEYVGNIDTPPDTYEPDKVGSISMEKLQQSRNNEIQLQRK